MGRESELVCIMWFVGKGGVLIVLCQLFLKVDIIYLIRRYINLPPSFTISKTFHLRLYLLNPKINFYGSS